MDKKMHTVPEPLTCYVFGEGSLLMKCCELLLKRSFKILGVFSCQPETEQWAVNNNITPMHKNKNWVKQLSSSEFDYLFSISNLSILPDEVITSPRICAVNYHDGPLPKYAGVNATSWSLMHKNKTHGITWHKITSGVDKGDILKQVFFDISSDETALSLNAKCFEQAYSCFGELIDDLINHTITPIPQVFKDRMYFGKYKRPNQAGVIDWDKTADDISHFLRALYFGNYTNPLGQPKIKIRDDFFAVPRIEVTELSSHVLPGTITGINENVIRVATKTCDVEIKKAYFLDGRPLAIKDLLNKYSLEAGFRFDDLVHDDARVISDTDASIAKYEPYWVKKLSGLDYADLRYRANKFAAGEKSVSKQEQIKFSREFTNFLSSFDAKPQVSLAAIFAIFMGRYSGKNDFNIGHSHKGLLCGGYGNGKLFSHYVPLRIQINPKLPIAEAIPHVAQEFESTAGHKTYQLDIWGRHPELRRQVTQCNVQDSPINIVFFNEMENYSSSSERVFNFVISGGLNSCRLVYHSPSVSCEELMSLKAQFLAFTEEIVQDPNRQIACISMLSESEKKKLFEEWNNTRQDLPAANSIHKLFEEQVKRTPESIAIVHQTGNLTYETLNSRSNQLAQLLLETGIKSESLVGVYMHHSPDMIIALLAILKAGGAYVPLDCTFPKDRIAYMIQNSDCSHILTEKSLRGEINSNKKIIEVDAKWDALSQKEAPELKLNVASNNLAYIIYTSGSTGKPKGVMIEHHNVINFFCGMDTCMGYEPNSGSGGTWLTATSISFDISVLEIFWTLTRGFKVVLGAECEIGRCNSDLAERGTDVCGQGCTPSSIPKLIQAHKVTHFQCTPSMASMLLLDKDAKRALKGLHTFLVGGEKLPASLAAQLKGIVKGDILNMYGPTETTVWSASYKLDSINSNIPIGKPIANTQIYLLDENLQAVPVGATGELMIAGEGVGRGYLNRPRLTSERFKKNPFSDAPESRLYRTGDLARYLPCGNIEFLGRIDHQIKLLGYRIELNEIENVLREHASIHDAVVLDQENENGQRVLVAYIIPVKEKITPARELRDYAKKMLPGYMVPAQIVKLKAFPQTPNKKIDRNAFPSIGTIQAGQKSAPKSIHAGLEAALANIWALVLEVPSVSLNDNFYDLGGDNAAAHRLLHIMRDTCDVELSIDAISDGATLQDFLTKVKKAFIKQAEAGYAPASLVDIEEKITEIWSDVLGVSAISTNDNFFDLGGNSLTGMQIAFTIQLEIGVDLPLAAVFNAPTVAQLSKLITDKTSRQMVSGKESEDAVTQPILAADNESSFPLSYVQTRFWFLQKLDPDQPVYNIAVALRISGNLNVGVLTENINCIIQRHAILRTTFPSKQGIPVQEVKDFIPLQIPLIDLTSSQNGGPGNKVKTILEQEARTPFRLDAESFLKIKLFKLGIEEHILLIVSHHLVLDGWSIRIFTQELGELYQAQMKNEVPNLPELPIQYGDYAAWEQSPVASEKFDEHATYWKNNLQAAPFVLELPTDFQRPPVETFDGEMLPIEISQALTQKLRNFSQSQGVTLFMTLLAAFQTVLYRYSHQQDLLVGTAVANINRSEIQHLLGSFSNNIVLRAVFKDNPTFIELLRQLRNTVLDAYGHQEFPFEKLLEEIQPERDLSRNPLFQAAFIFHESTLERNFDNDELRIDRIPVDLGSSRFDLTLEVDDSSQGIVGFFEFKKDLYTKETIANMARHFKMLLKSVLEEPNIPVSLINILSGKEKERLLVELNSTDAEYPKQACLHQLVEGKAKEAPDLTAVICKDDSLSYKELNARANKVANYLQGLGVKPEELVGICADRSLEMIVGLLGILKAGCAYVPLDPAFPAERLQFMIEDANISTLLTYKQPAGMFSDFKGNFVKLDQDWKSISAASPENPNTDISSEALAYVIFTSGSTGKPKGVQIPHLAVVNFLLSMQKSPGLSEGDKLLSVTTISFDISVLELFLPLITGACTIIANREQTIDGRLLLKLLKQSEATVMQATPATWRLLMEAGWDGPSDLNMWCGGEAFSSELAHQMLSRGHSLWNMYGPTETTIWSSVKQITEEQDQVLIGPPIANTQFYVCDEAFNPVPVGVSGELLIGGDGLARGYLKRPELTSKHFIGNPFDSGASRLFKTGDLVRQRKNGDIEFLGRLDFQVKVRGFRIELGEIENVLCSHSSIKEAKVIVCDDASENKILVGYITPAMESAAGEKELKNYLRERLPEYMIPSQIIKLDEFPLTANLKVDRKSLPVPEFSRTEARPEQAAPEDELEIKISAIWKRLLGIQSVGVDENFFELGGHSLLAARLFAQIEKEFGKTLPFATLFQAPTISGIATILRQKEWQPDWASLVPIKTNGSKPPIFLVHGAEGNVLLYRELAHYLGPNQPVYGLQSQGLDGRIPLQHDFESMAKNYIKEIKTVQPEGPYLLGGYCLGGTIAFEMAQQLHEQGEETALLAMFETYNIQVISDTFPFYYRWYHMIQNIVFHLESIWRINSKDRLVFLKQKMGVEWSRFKVMMNIASSRMINKLRKNNGIKYHHLLVDKLNDQAQERYKPKVYAGRVTLFKPKGSFAGLNDACFGWGGLALKGVKVVNIPFGPKAILTEPFVQLFAQKLSEEAAWSISNYEQSTIAESKIEPQELGIPSAEDAVHH